jgi:hypothetical protein
MKNSNYRFTVLVTFGFMACACLFAMSTWGQVKVENQTQNPNSQPIKIGKDGNAGGNRPPETLESKVSGLVRRVETLEDENKELKQQMFAAKLLLSGLDKAFGSHTHSLSPHVSSTSLRQLDVVPGNVRDRWQILTISTGQTTTVVTGPPVK